MPTTTGTQKAAFPNEIGYLWTYEYHDLVVEGIDTSHVYDTVDVVVIRDTALCGGEEARIWVFRYHNEPIPDTQLVATVGDTIKIYRDTEPFLVTILLPYDTSAEWTSGGGRIDTTTVTGPHFVSVKGGIFNETYWLKRNWSGLEESENSAIWLVHGVGIIWFGLHLTAPMMNPPEVSRSWELLSYDFPP